jgi:glutamine---fructose-6-phosphate transaminase (isomerizing)
VKLEKGALIFGIVNGVGSSIARETDTGIYIHVGPEIGVASTKAFTGQVTVLTLLALALGHELGTLNNADYYQMIEELSEIPQKMEKVLEQAPIIKDISRMFTYAHNFLYLGRGVNYPVGNGAGNLMTEERTLPPNPCKSIVTYQWPELGTVRIIGDLVALPP